MAPPTRAIALTSLASSYLVVAGLSAWSTTRFAATFLGIFLAQLSAYGVWRAVLYPKLFSPLIGLPEPKGGSFFNGHWKRIRAEPTGHPMRDW